MGRVRFTYVGTPVGELLLAGAEGGGVKAALLALEQNPRGTSIAPGQPQETS